MYAEAALRMLPYSSERAPPPYRCRFPPPDDGMYRSFQAEIAGDAPHMRSKSFQEVGCIEGKHSTVMTPHLTDKTFQVLSSQLWSNLILGRVYLLKDLSITFNTGNTFD